MKRIIAFIVILLSFNSWSQGGNNSSEKESKLVDINNSLENQLEDDTLIYQTPDELAKFPGGISNYLKATIVYPEQALKDTLEGKGYLNFIIEKDGSISKIIVKRGIPDCRDCDKEAVRVMSICPKWIPAKNDGKIVRSSYNVMFVFKFP